MKNQRAIGIVQVMLAGTCFGFLGLFGKQAFAKNIQAQELLGIRFVLSGSLMLLALAIFSKKLHIISLKMLVTCALLGVGGYAVFSSCYFLSVQGLSMSLAVLLLYTYPLFVAVGSWLILHEAMPRSKILVVPLSFVGTALVIWGDFHVQSWLAVFLGIAAGLSYSLYIIGSSRWLKNVDALVASALIQLAAGLALVALSFTTWSRASEVFSVSWPQIVGLAIVCSIIPITSFQLGLQKVRGWEASLLSTIEPIVAISLSVFVMHEGFSIVQIAGTALVLLSLIWVAWPHRVARS